ncbi:unnamed protein product [Cyprideis torosa]|uniref:DNA polymerase n=1 Tax=Cyprideis torosa TaxID=163714 RepID=A0A7R8W4T5_9CRUS|nr:unnamed protein product [Cyprideis torosa]CAG0884565.1 unnamed protein product [Cyprideis torosa]
MPASQLPVFRIPAPVSLPEPPSPSPSLPLWCLPPESPATTIRKEREKSEREEQSPTPGLDVPVDSSVTSAPEVCEENKSSAQAELLKLAPNIPANREKIMKLLEKETISPGVRTALQSLLDGCKNEDVTAKTPAPYSDPYSSGPASVLVVYDNVNEHLRDEERVSSQELARLYREPATPCPATPASSGNENENSSQESSQTSQETRKEQEARKIGVKQENGDCGDHSESRTALEKQDMRIIAQQELQKASQQMQEEPQTVTDQEQQKSQVETELKTAEQVQQKQQNIEELVQHESPKDAEHVQQESQKLAEQLQGEPQKVTEQEEPQNTSEQVQEETLAEQFRREPQTLAEQVQEEPKKPSEQLQEDEEIVFLTEVKRSEKTADREMSVKVKSEDDVSRESRAHIAKHEAERGIEQIHGKETSQSQFLQRKPTEPSTLGKSTSQLIMESMNMNALPIAGEASVISRIGQPKDKLEAIRPCNDCPLESPNSPSSGGDVTRNENTTGGKLNTVDGNVSGAGKVLDPRTSSCSQKPNPLILPLIRWQLHPAASSSNDLNAPSDARIAPSSSKDLNAPSDARIAPSSSKDLNAPSDARIAPSSSKDLNAPSDARIAPSSSNDLNAPSDTRIARVPPMQQTSHRQSAPTSSHLNIASKIPPKQRFYDPRQECTKLSSSSKPRHSSCSTSSVTSSRSDSFVESSNKFKGNQKRWSKMVQQEKTPQTAVSNDVGNASSEVSARRLAASSKNRARRLDSHACSPAPKSRKLSEPRGDVMGSILSGGFGRSQSVQEPIRGSHSSKAQLPTRSHSLFDIPDDPKDGIDMIDQFDGVTDEDWTFEFSKSTPDFATVQGSLRQNRINPTVFCTRGDIPQVRNIADAPEFESCMGDGSPMVGWRCDTLCKESLNDEIKPDDFYKLSDREFLQHFESHPSLVESPHATQLRLSRRESQIDAVSFEDTFAFKVQHSGLQGTRSKHDYQHLTIMSLEILCESRRSLLPDPRFDQVLAVFYAISNDYEPLSAVPELIQGAIILDPNGCNDPAIQTSHRPSNLMQRTGMSSFNVRSAYDEVELLQGVADIVQYADPDILIGYEVEKNSWGYLIERAAILGFALTPQLSRVVRENGGAADRKGERREVPGPSCNKKPSEGTGGVAEDEEFGFEIPLEGRIVINLWRQMRKEANLMSYSFESMAFHVLHKRIPKFTPEQLSTWWSSHLQRWRTAEYLSLRAKGNLDLLEKLDFVGRTSELARLFGIQFFEVLSRGSQFRVESIMLRLAKGKNLVSVSPSVEQRAKMKAPECLPLIMEPESRYYTDPVLVLDFQSLYPSVIIAYNYCFSTCVGRADLVGQIHPFEFGCTNLRIPLSQAESLLSKGQLTISPCGVAFVTPAVRKGILPIMLQEILTTRIMVKQSLKLHSGNKALARVLDARQLGLKLIANVTYGYTSANFSGRMPAVEIADSVVSKGRETLERAIHLVENNPEWKAHVVYGDTDSMFVLLRGRSKAEAFRIGKEIAERVTQENPKPVKLKFEKVYYPCVLQTKKRYVGYMYESEQQESPVYDAKGIETVRRDGCPAVAKILEKSLRILFETNDLSQVKAYVQKQFTKIHHGRVDIGDMTFAREFRGRFGYKEGACVPAMEITKRQMQADPRAEPCTGERVPYVITYGAPGLPLIQLVRTPIQARNCSVLSNPGLRLNAEYYITRAIVPPLDRCLGLLGVSSLQWYTDLPRFHLPQFSLPQGLSSGGGSAASSTKKSTISQYFSTVSCPGCLQVVFGLVFLQRTRSLPFFGLSCAQSEMAVSE